MFQAPLLLDDESALDVDGNASAYISPDLVHAKPGALGTLDAVAAMVARLRPQLRCAILLLEDRGLTVAAQHALQPDDWLLLRALAPLSSLGALSQFASANRFEVKPLLTDAAEFIGVIALFSVGGEVLHSVLESELDEVCWIATLTIEQKHLLEEVTYHAHHDPLTHLWNRLRMEQEIERALTSSTHAGGCTGLALIGIDSFRIINDVLGCEAGDILLQQVAQRLIPALDPSFALARAGGDEFMILMPDLESADEAELISARLLRALSDSFYVGDHELSLRASVGCVAADPGRHSAGEIQGQANIALRYAKKRERGRVAVFSASMARVPPERLVMEQHLRFAIQKREFELYYQPQVDLRTGVLVGAEALLRWRHPSLGFISPGTFIPIAEEIGLIEEIGDWALDEALRYLKRCAEAGLLHLRMAVNVSGIQFSRSDFGASVARKLRKSRVSPENLELEITETVMMSNFEHGLRQLKILRSLGVQLAVDDFGTGHSSLAYLQQLPIQRLKIDRMFVRDISSRDERPPLLRSIIDMSHALGLSVIAEGIETVEQAIALTAMNCEEMQGFLIAKPLSADAFVARFATAESLRGGRAEVPGVPFGY